MRKRDKNRQWSVEMEDGFRLDGKDICVAWETGNNKYRGQRLTEVNIGEWLKVELIKGRKNARERYRVTFGGTPWIVSFTDNGEVRIQLAWALSLVEAKPTNIGQLNRYANKEKKQ